MVQITALGKLPESWMDSDEHVVEVVRGNFNLWEAVIDEAFWWSKCFAVIGSVCAVAYFAGWILAKL